MQKTWVIALFLPLIIFIASCSEDQQSPEEVVNNYLEAQLDKNWKEVCNSLVSSSANSVAETIDPSGQSGSCKSALENAPRLSQDSFSSTAQFVSVEDTLEERDSFVKLALSRKGFKEVVKIIPGQELKVKPDFIARGYVVLEKQDGGWKISLRKSNWPQSTLPEN